MGLDMFAFKVKKGSILKPIDFSDSDFTEKPEELHYWRKHPNLHGWMEELYKKKGGESEFNCANLLLTPKDLDQLEYDIVNRNLEETSGFFFGNSDGSEDVDDIEFINDARRAIEDGNDVYYSSWW